MKKLKILVLNKKERLYAPNRTIDQILDSLKEQTICEDFWILTESGQGDLSGFDSSPILKNYKFFEDYNTNNVIKILEEEEPDVILISNDYDFWSRSFLLAAKFKKIPTVLLMQFSFDYITYRSDSIIRGRLLHFKERAKFLLGKYFLLLRTYRKIGKGFFYILKKIYNDLIDTFSQFEPSGRYGCDLILVNNEKLKKTLEKINLNSKIIITGDPQMDSITNKISYQKKISSKNKNSKLKVVFLTTSMVEHGLWTQNMWEDTVRKVISEIQNNLNSKIELVLKIHPGSEKRIDYENLLNKYHFDVPILQTEDLLDVLDDADFVISYGDTWALWEVLLLNKPILLMNLFNYPIDMMPFVKENIAYELTNVSQIKEIIPKLHPVELDEPKIKEFIQKYLFKLDGKSGERSANAILELIHSKKS
jgi:hypothetical protein